MILGLQVPDFTWPDGPEQLGSGLRRIAVDAESAGVSSFWLMDHFFQISMVGPPEHDMLEGWSALSHVAAVTERITLGTLVTGVTYRHPGILVKTATTLDVLSGGRAWFGIGAAWNEEEHAGLGVPYPPLAERFELLEETLRIATQMWAGDDRPFHGKHYHLTRPLNSPQSVRRPHPPIMIGGTGEKKTLRMVAQYADACNIFEMPALPAKLDVLRRHCEDLGRDYATIEKTSLGTLDLRTTSLDDAVRRFEALAAQGIDHAIVSLPNVSEPGAFDAVAQLVERLAPVVPEGR